MISYKQGLVPTHQLVSARRGGICESWPWRPSHPHASCCRAASVIPPWNSRCKIELIFGVMLQFNVVWCIRSRREIVLTIQSDNGKQGYKVGGKKYRHPKVVLPRGPCERYSSDWIRRRDQSWARSVPHAYPIILGLSMTMTPSSFLTPHTGNHMFIYRYGSHGPWRWRTATLIVASLVWLYYKIPSYFSILKHVLRSLSSVSDRICTCHHLDGKANQVPVRDSCEHSSYM